MPRPASGSPPGAGAAGPPPGAAGGLWWQVEGSRGAPPLVLVPDAHRPASIWPPALVDGLVGVGWRVVRLDLADQGRSPRVGAADGPLTVERMAADVGALLATTGPAHLLGHGLGATVALRLALGGDVDLVSRLTLVGATGWPLDPTLPGPDEPTAVGLVWRFRLGEGDGLATALGREERLLAGPDDPGPQAAEAEVRRWLAHGFNPADGHRSAWLTAPPVWDDLAGAAAAGRLPPLTVVHGGADPLVPVAHGRRLAACVGGAPLVEAEGAGHALTPRLTAALLAALGRARR